MDGNLVVRSPSFCWNRFLVRAATSATARPAQCSADANSSRHQCIQFRPCIDIHQGKVKQIVGSTLSDQPGNAESLVTNFETEKSAAEFAQLYRRDSLFGGHVIMLGSDEASQNSALEAVNAFPGGLQLGGGVTPNNAKKYLDSGASHVIVTSFIFTDGKLDFEKLKELVQVVGKNRLVVDLSCRKVVNVDVLKLTADKLKSVNQVVDEEEERLYKELYEELEETDQRISRTRHVASNKKGKNVDENKGKGKGKGNGKGKGKGKGKDKGKGKGKARGSSSTATTFEDEDDLVSSDDDEDLADLQEPEYDDDGNLLSEGDFIFASETDEEDFDSEELLASDHSSDDDSFTITP